jgi:hypothetical protein
MKNKPLKIIMSRGDDIPVDSDELPNILEGIRNRSPVKIRNGIFNPSFYISIVEDKKRVDEWREDIKYGDRPELKENGPKLLKDIFEGLETKNKLLQ